MPDRLGKQVSALSGGKEGDGRSAARFKVFQPATIGADGVRRRGHILNVSTTGAMVHAAVEVVVGSLIRICVVGLERTGTVTWKSTTKLGVRFTRPISVKQIDDLRRDAGSK
jgi:hypothetical protein